MIITCPYCKKEHSVDEKKIPANARAARCKSCGNRFPLHLEASSPESHDIPPAEGLPKPEDKGDGPASEANVSPGESPTQPPPVFTPPPEPVGSPKTGEQAKPSVPAEDEGKGAAEVRIIETLPVASGKAGTPPGATTAMGDTARKIAVSLSKGGVGKTTTAVNLAVGLSLANRKVLLVDTDTQGQTSFMLGVKPKFGFTELATGELTAGEAVFRVNDHLFLLAGGKSLAGLKRLISRKDFGGEMTIAETILPLEGAYDYIIFDTSPGWDVLTVNVLFCVNEVLLPVSLEAMTLQGLAQFLQSVASVKKYRPELEVRYLLPTFFDKRLKRSFIILEKLQSLYGDQVCTPIRTNISLSEAPAYGKTIYEYAPGSYGAEDYRELVRKVIGG